MVGDVDEQPLDDEGIAPADHEGVLGALAHIVTVVGGGVAVEE